jgi:hypothetical protein
MEKYNCLVCNREMESKHLNMYEDHFCNTQKDHNFSWRIRHNNLAKLRIRFMTGQERLCLKIHYDEGYSEVWSKINTANRIRINQIVVPDFTDLEKLKNKIRTLLVFG